jgi:RNA polymerase sigma-70 factor (ECF subfamily)
MASRVLRNEETAKDAVQEAFIKAYASLSKFEGRAKFYTWFYRLVLNQCLDMKRKDRPERFADFGEVDPLEVAARQQPQPNGEEVSFQPAADMMRRELQGHLGEAVEQLPDAPRETLLMREVDGLSYAEIAKALGIPKGTVMSRLHYARKRLQELLIEAGAVDPARGGKES